MSKDTSNTTSIFNTKLTKQGNPHSPASKLLRFEEIVIPSPTATAKNLNTLIGKSDITTNSSVNKPRQTNKEYMTTQKVYDVLKEPEDFKPVKSALSLKPINMKCTAVPLIGNKMIHISFPQCINATLKEQLATISNEAAFRSKPTVTVKLPTEDASPASATTLLVDNTIGTTNITIPTIISPTTVVSTANPTKLTESLKNSEIDVGVSQPPKATATATATEIEKIITVTKTAETEIESFNSKPTSTSSLEISAVDIKGKVTTNTAPITAPSASQTESIACNNITQKLTFNKKSVMRSVNIPLSIASKAHKTLAFTGPKMPIRPLIKSRNCVLLSTKSNTTTKDKGIIKFIPKSPWPKKYVADECDEMNPTDSNSNDALFSKDAEKSPEAGKEVLVITTDIDTKKTAGHRYQKNVPLVGKRKYTDPAMMPILSFSYQKSLSDYIRKAKEFHKRAKICTTTALATIDNSKINEVESAKNFISTDSDGSGNKDNTNMKCDHESNLKQCVSTAERRKEVTTMEVEETANGESENKEKSTYMEITEKIGSIKYVKSATKDIDNLKDMETVEKLENVRTTSLDNLRYLKSLTDVKSAGNPEGDESGENTDDFKKDDSANGTKKTEDIKSTERTNNTREEETAKGIKNLNDIESAENRDQLKDLKSGKDTDNLKDMESVIGIKVKEDIESTEHTNNSREKETEEGIKNLKDIESAENKDQPNDLQSTGDIENSKDMKSAESENNIKYEKSAENTEKLKDIDTKILKDVESKEHRETPKDLNDNFKVMESAECPDNLKEIESAERTQNRKNVEYTGDTDSPEEVKSARGTVNLKDIEAAEGTDRLKDLESTESIKIVQGIESAKCAYKLGLKSAQETTNRSEFGSAKSIYGLQDLESTESTETLKVVKSTEGADNLTGVESIKSTTNLKDIKSAEDSNSAKNIESAEVKEILQHMESTECLEYRKNIATTAEKSNQIDIESDLFTYEIFNNVSGINNASTRNVHTQTKDSTTKILKNIFELKEKVQQQAEEIMLLKAAMKLLKTPNMYIE